MLSGNIPVTWTSEDFYNVNYDCKVGDQYLTSEDSDQPAYSQKKDYISIVKLDVYNADSIADKFFNGVDHFPWLKNKTYTLQRIPPGGVIPLHFDVYIAYKKKYNITDINKIKRIIIFLEDWKSGHILEVNNELVMPWKAGDWICWTGDDLHIAANIGLEMRHTFQITGHIE
jgi:hypothetical protein